MGNIVLLDDLTINKIAAGEVIERPASVVKELMENSIDAGAKKITTEIKNGGITYIRITDDGKGILPDDMEIAFERHATSKIRNAKDLEKVKSMGFRGEALASIAAIAKVTMTSKVEGNDYGYKIVVEGGNIVEKEQIGCPKGTTIVVENLFFNTPVRYKFLKKDFTETGYIEDAVKRIALVNPEVAIKLINMNKTSLQTIGNGILKDTIYSVYGKETAENIIEVDYELDGVKVKGCVGKSEIAKSNRAGQIFFVNKRYVRDKILTSAVEQATRGIVLPGKYIFLVLNLEIDPQTIDVNVHPAKLEIRFQEENKIFKLIYHAVKEAYSPKTEKSYEIEEIEEKNILEEENTVSEIPSIKSENIYDLHEENKVFNTGNVIEDIFNQKIYNEIASTPAQHKATEVVPNTTHHLTVDEILKNAAETKIAEAKTSETKTVEDNSKNVEDEKQDDYDSSFAEMYKKTFGITCIPEKKKEEVEDKKPEEDTVKFEKASITSRASIDYFTKVKYKYVGIAFMQYIIIEIDGELFIVDQRKANERVIYEDLISNYLRNNKRDSQLMLLPDIVELTDKEMDIVRDNIMLFKKTGFEVDEFGDNTIKLSGVPSICIDLDTKELFIQIINDVNKIARIEKKEIVKKVMETVAVKVAEKATLGTSFEEVDVLMQKLLRLNEPFKSASDKNIAIKLTKEEIEKKFK